MLRQRALSLTAIVLIGTLLVTACGRSSPAPAETQPPLPATATLPTPIPAQPKPQFTAVPPTSALEEPTAASPAPAETPVDEVQSFVDARVEDLLSHMTLAEKIGQMTQVESDSITPDEVIAYAIGSVLTGEIGRAHV